MKMNEQDSKIEKALRELTDPSSGELSRLQDRLVADARASGSLDVVYRLVDSPVGRLLVAATSKGIVRVAFEIEGFDSVLSDVAAKVGPAVLRSSTELEVAAQQIDAYFDGSRHAFDLPLDDRLSAGFRQLVQRHLPQIAYGSTQTYKQVAELVGNPGAVRAVGAACATNPLPIVVPCHRVLRTDGTIGGYLGGPDAKRTLLDLERQAA
ncbi:methylated-DNA--[protein]-cysteine S-methyltransferase [Agrococcus casei]|uniref:methylated-DNA--[protein]-cysteine S-methyltransferase n=1 Tax=Agrococcus casei TaxID=343512 RepID=UPI003F8EFE51